MKKYAAYLPTVVLLLTTLASTATPAIAAFWMNHAAAAAIFAPLLGSLIGFGALKGKCPWCDSPVSSVTGPKVFYCLACNQGISIKNRNFVRAEG